MENCSKCKKDYKKDHEIFSCDSCKTMLCGSCGGLTPSEIKCLQLKKGRKLIFLCEKCENGLWKVPSLIEEIKEIKNSLNELLQNKVNTTETPTFDTEELINEMMERQKRANNIIIFNVKESTAVSRGQRIVDETNTVEQLLSEVDGVGNFKVIRVGRYDVGKTRPLKIIFESHEEALRVLKNRQKVIQKVPSIRLYSDQTIKQREYFKSIKTRFDNMVANGDNSKMIKYVNNIPKIVNKIVSKN